jgi:hypothetical protein
MICGEPAIFSTPQQVRSFADSAGVIQEAAAVTEQLFAFAGQQQAASYTIEKFEA